MNTLMMHAGTDNLTIYPSPSPVASATHIREPSNPDNVTVVAATVDSRYFKNRKQQVKWI
jgi:hypothetical protein